VIPFVWAVDKAGYNAGITNIDDVTINELVNSSKGHIPRSVFTGVAGDSSLRVYLTGRNPDSGTRLSTFAVSGAGALTSVIQWEPKVGSADASAVGSTITSLTPWAPDTVNFVKISGSNSGYSSGGNLAKAIGSIYTTATSNDGYTGGNLVTYLGYADYLAATTSSATAYGAVALSYNGTPFSYTALENGQYHFWGYEHLYLNPITSQAALINTLATQIHDGTPAVLNSQNSAGVGFQVTDVLANMNVERGGTDKDGQPFEYSTGLGF